MPSGNQLTRRVLPLLPLLLPVFFYLAVFLFWHSHEWYGLTGDEPHYLLIADSLYRDHDLRVENNYLIETPVQRACKANLSDPVDMQRHLRNGYSMHNPGLPLLLVIPYSIAGVTGAKIFMTLLAGFWPFLLYKAAFQILESKPWSILIALTLALGLPYLPASNQIYVDLLGGMIILYVAERVVGILRGHYERVSSPARHLWMGLLLGFLPWLHTRLSAPAILLLLGYVYAHSAGMRRLADRHRWPLLTLAIVAGSGLLLAAYNQFTFGNALFGPYYGYLSSDLRKIVLTFVGLHWDMAHGIFMQQPLLLLGLFGIVPLVKDNWQSALLLALLSLSVLVPNSTISLWYGAASFFGRYHWAILSLWTFPLACAVKLLFKYRKAFILPLCVCALILQGWMAGRWLFNDGLLINTGWPVWAARNFYLSSPWLLLRFPFFKNVNDYENLYDCLRQPANYICLLLSALLVLSGWFAGNRRAGRTLLMAWLLFLVAAASVIALIPPAFPYWSVAAYLLPSQVGSLSNTDRIAREGESRPGYLIYGPYATLLEGRYEVKLEYESGSSYITGAPRFDIAYDLGRKVIGEADLPPSATNGGTFKYSFQVDKEMSMKKPFEFRVLYTGSGTLMIKRLTVTYLYP